MADSGWKRWERGCAERFSRWLCGVNEKQAKVEHNRIISRQSLLGRMVEERWGDMAIHPKCSDRMMPAAKWFMRTFIVDAKKRKTFRLPSLLTSPNHDFWKWWQKTTDDSIQPDGVKFRLMTLLDHNSKAHILAFGRRESRHWTDQLGFMRPFPFFLISHRLKLEDGDREEITFCEFEKFLEWADPVALGCPEVQ